MEGHSIPDEVGMNIPPIREADEYEENRSNSDSNQENIARSSSQNSDNYNNDSGGNDSVPGDEDVDNSSSPRNMEHYSPQKSFKVFDQ